MTDFHPQQTSEQLPPYLAERLHSSDGDAAWSDRHGRDSARPKLADSGTAAPKQEVPGSCRSHRLSRRTGIDGNRP
jgi:hypothetical protein